MDIVEFMTPLMGTWKGVNRLRLMPTDDYQDSPATAEVSQTAKGFVSVAYTWFDGNEPQDGLLLIGGKSGPDAVWVDSWHSGGSWMIFSGSIDDGVLKLTGSYPAQSGPDWGWHIHFEPGNGEGGKMTMHNVVPGAEPYQVVEATYGH
jgi:hypothetical protein